MFESITPLLRSQHYHCALRGAAQILCFEADRRHFVFLEVIRAWTGAHQSSSALFSESGTILLTAFVFENFLPSICGQWLRSEIVALY